MRAFLTTNKPGQKYKNLLIIYFITPIEFQYIATTRVKGYPYTRLNRPSGLQEDDALTIYRQLAKENGNVVNPMHWLPSPPGDIPGTHIY